MATTSKEAPTLATLSEQIEANSRVLGLILLILAGHPLPRQLLFDVAWACGVSTAELDEHADRGH